MLLYREREREREYEIVFCDTGKEFPEMYKHIDKFERYIGKKITRLKPDSRHKFDYLMFDHVKVKGKSKGQKGYGWAYSNARWCSQNIKRDIQNKYYRNTKGDYIEYVGIAFDELQRCNMDEKNKKYPLVEWKVTEGEALKYCYDHGFDWDGLYTRFDRVSCWCCPFANLRELRNLYVFYPELWKQLKDMDNRSWNSFKKDKSVQDLEDRFKREIEEAGVKL